MTHQHDVSTHAGAAKSHRASADRLLLWAAHIVPSDTYMLGTDEVAQITGPAHQ